MDVPRDPAPMTAREAAGLLGDLDTLSDADVEHVLDRVLARGERTEDAAVPAASWNNAVPSNGTIRPAVAPPVGGRELSDLATVLDRLDDLADERVDALLAQLMEERDDG